MIVLLGLAAIASDPAPLPIEHAPGLLYEVTSLEQPDLREARIARMPALYIPESAPASAFVPAGPFRSTWTGLLNVSLWDEYRIHALGRGHLRMTVGETEAFAGELDANEVGTSAPLDLKRGRHEVRIEYTSPDAGDAWLRLEWSCYDFAARPIDPERWSHDPEEARLRGADLLQHGRMLVAQRQCAQCHLDGEHWPASAMPEALAPPPDLQGLGTRLRPSWIARWLVDPRQLRAHATMPRTLAAVDPSEPEVRDLVAFLTRTEEETTPDAGNDPAAAGGRAVGDAEAGAVLFERFGCVFCHDLEGIGSVDSLGPRVSLALVGEKWLPGALVDFLRDPRRWHPGSAMPDFELDEREAAHLAAFLIADVPRSAAYDLGGADLARGAAVYREAGCSNCHDSPGSGDATGRVPLSSAPEDRAVHRRGCLAANREERGSAPNFQFDAPQRTALLAFLRQDPTAVSRDDPADYSRRAFTANRCGACHDRDGAASLWSWKTSESRAEAPRGGTEDVLQLRPDLTFAGEGLRPEWMSELFRGATAPVRPWLHAHMPVFAVDPVRLAHGLAAEHGFAPHSEPLAEIDPELARIGDELASVERGFACVQCHDRGLAEAAGVFDAQGPNFALVPSRLRRAYFDRLLLDPLVVLKGNRMPRFVEDGRTGIFEHFGGEPAPQFEALWQFMVQLHANTREENER